MTTLLFFLALFPLTVFAAPGVPFVALQGQVDTLQTDVNTLKTDLNTIVLTPGPTGPAGPTGAKGDQGIQGLRGADGVTPWTDEGGVVSTTGSIQIGDENVLCDATAAGTIRFIGTDFEGCNGIAWVSLTLPGPVYAIGDTGPAGGIVFYIIDNGLSGLEAAPADQGTAPWGCFGIVIPGADGFVVGTGAQNTADILAGCNEAGIAADIADAFTLNGFADWFLPSKHELNLLFHQKAVVGGFARDWYWSSSEVSSGGAWSKGFHIHWINRVSPKESPKIVRAVRAF